MNDIERVFKALADPTRRLLLDRLHERNGQTLTELCTDLDMARQSATQHLDLLHEANLISTIRNGRARLHYLNPVPWHEMQERWIDKFESRRLRTSSTIKRHAEDAMTDRPTVRYVTYIESTPAMVWHALTDADLTAEYWGHANVSDWNVGSRWEHQRTDGSQVADVTGVVLVSDPPLLLATSWCDPNEPDTPAERVTFTIEPFGEIVRLTVTHEDLANNEEQEMATSGWSAVIANLKSLLETGHVLPQRPWEMP
jgi:uncharacterized protein YndB with AHSA1/START domain/DNA-binding transcriptional ArsR family regulator